MSTIGQILIVDKMHENIVTLLELQGFIISAQPAITRDEILNSIGDFEGLIIRSKTHVDKELIDAGKNLKFVARAGAGLDMLDTVYLEQKNIQILNAPEGNRDAVGEHTLGLLLNLLSKISRGNQEVRNGQWNREANRGMELKGKIVGIFGCGNSGSAFARKLKGMDCIVIGYDKYKSNYANENIEEVDLKEFRERTEILSIHVPLTEETRLMFSKEELKRYPNLKIILNTARGEILKLADAIELLQSNKLIGLGLDVLENEKLEYLNPEQKDVFEKLISHSNVILTPHVAGWTQESYERIGEVLAKKIGNLNLL